jgi:hypothetical protein
MKHVDFVIIVKYSIILKNHIIIINNNKMKQKLLRMIQNPIIFGMISLVQSYGSLQLDLQQHVE